MNKILACIDPRGNTDAVIDWAAWAALRTGRPLEFLHVLERHPERATVTDYSGAIGVDSQESLLKDLSDQDEQCSVAMRQAGRELLAHARSRAAAAGAERLDARLRHGDLVDTAVEFQDEVDLFILGEHHHPAPAQARARIEHHLERVIRAVSSSVLVATTEAFAAPQHVVVAFDGSLRARKALARVAQHRLVEGLPVLVTMVGTDTAQARQQLKEAQAALQETGTTCDTELVAGDPQQVLPELVKRHAPALLVMGAFGHSRLRQLLLGSTTTTLLRLSKVPVLILR